MERRKGRRWGSLVQLYCSGEQEGKPARGGSAQASLSLRLPARPCRRGGPRTAASAHTHSVTNKYGGRPARGVEDPPCPVPGSAPAAPSGHARGIRDGRVLRSAGPGQRRTPGSREIMDHPGRWPQLSTQRSRRLNCRLSLRRRCSRPRSRRSSSSRALGGMGSSQCSVGRVHTNPLREHVLDPPNSQRRPAPLTSAPCGPGPGPARHAGSPATPAPPAGAALGAAVRTFSSSLRVEAAKRQEARARRCAASTLARSCLLPPEPMSHLRWPAWPAALGSAAQTFAPSPAPRCWTVQGGGRSGKAA